MLINYKNFEDKIYKIIKFINKIDIINCIRKLNNSLFKINFNNISKVN